MAVKRLNQRGAALIVAVLTVAVVLGILVYNTAVHYQSMLGELFRQRNQIAAFQMLQDFAILAQKANNVFVTNGGVACPGGFTQRPLGQPFCWSNTPNTNCVRIAKDSQDPNAPQAVCLDAAASMDLALIPQDVGPVAKLKFVAGFLYSYRRELAGLAIESVERWIESRAWAQVGREPHLPVLGAGGPPLILDTLNCPGNPACKVCGAGGNVTCINLRICLNPLGCPLPADWSEQRIGILTR